MRLNMCLEFYCLAGTADADIMSVYTLLLSAFSCETSLWFALQLKKNLSACILLLAFYFRGLSLEILIPDNVFPFFPQVCQISVQPPVNGELILRFQQLQSRLATLNIENEEVKQCK